jgi:hypothetical protein
VPDVRRAARDSYRALLEPGRAEVLRQLRLAGKGKEERWEGLRRWLRNPDELSDWRVLAVLLLRLAEANPDAQDPVTTLSAFLARDSFTIEVRSATLEIPDRLGVRPRPGALLKVYHPASGREPALALEPRGAGERDAARAVTRYAFRRTEASRLTYRPWDRLWADLLLVRGRVFTWSDSRTARYQLECLRRPPRLQRDTEKDIRAGSLQPDVRLLFTPEDGVPRVPDLLPRERGD